MKIRVAVGCFAAALMTGASFAADVPVTSLYRPAPYIPQQQVAWTGIYFGVNAGYGWAQHTSNVRFKGNPNFGGLTNPSPSLDRDTRPNRVKRGEFNEFY